MVRKGLILAAVLAAALGLGTANAGAETFGADLNGASNNNGTCLGNFGQNSCTIFSGLPGPWFYSPILGTGTVTQVRVKTGAGGSGAMQPIVMRSLYQNKQGDPGHPYFACCFVEEYGPVFAATPNSINTVPTSMTMVEDATPPANDFTTNARGDFLALSVLTGNAAFPGNLDGSSNFSCIYPAPTAQTYPAPSPNPILVGSCGVGFHVMMDATIQAAGGGGGGGGGGKAPQGNPLQFPTGGSLVGTTANIPLVCVLTTACDGTVQLTNGATGAGIAAKPKVYGSKKFSIPAGKKRTVKVKLNKAGKRKLGRKRSLTLTVVAKIGAQTQTGKIKFKKKKKKR